MCAHATFSIPQDIRPSPVFLLPFRSRLYIMSSSFLTLSIKDFFEKVPGSVDARGRVEKAVELCAKECVDIRSPEDLVGATVKAIVDAGLAGAVSSGLQSFLKKAIDLADDCYAARKGVRPGADAEAAIDAMSSRPAQQPIHIDIGSTIGTRGGVFGMAQWMLSSLCVFVGALCLTGLAQPVWPKTSAVDALATEAKRLGNTGIKDAYVYVDIKCPPKNQACSCLANRSWVVGLCVLFFLQASALRSFVPEWAIQGALDNTPVVENPALGEGFNALADQIALKIHGPNTGAAHQNKYLDMNRQFLWRI